MRSDTNANQAGATESGKIYRRLPGRGTRRIGPVALMRISCRLYLGSDHLLCVDSTGYTEEYRRFYYPDIQAVLVRKTNRGKAWNWALAALTTVTAAIALALSGAWAIALWSSAGACLLFLLINLGRGPTCIAHLRTAVHLEEMPSINRLRVARKVLAQLKPRIEQAQGVLASEELASHFSAIEPGAGPAQPLGPGADKQKLFSQRPAITSQYQGRLHWLLFSLLLLETAETVIALFVQSVVMSVAATVLMAAVSISTVLSLVQQQGSELSRFVKNVTWATLGYVGLNFALGYVLLFYMSISDPSIRSDQWRYLEAFSRISPFDTPWMMALQVHGIVTSLGLGLTGIVALRAWGRSNQARLATPVPPEETVVSPGAANP